MQREQRVGALGARPGEPRAGQLADVLLGDGSTAGHRALGCRADPPRAGRKPGGCLDPADGEQAAPTSAHELQQRRAAVARSAHRHRDHWPVGRQSERNLRVRCRRDRADRRSGRGQVVHRLSRAGLPRDRGWRDRPLRRVRRRPCLPDDPGRDEGRLAGLDPRLPGDGRADRRDSVGGLLHEPQAIRRAGADAFQHCGRIALDPAHAAEPPPSKCRARRGGDAGPAGDQPGHRRDRSCSRCGAGRNPRRGGWTTGQRLARSGHRLEGLLRGVRAGADQRVPDQLPHRPGPDRRSREPAGRRPGAATIADRPSCSACSGRWWPGARR